MKKAPNKSKRGADCRLIFTLLCLFEQGEIFVNNGKCQIVQRHLIFNGGIAYGIDCLLTPPSLGGRCDKQMTFELTVKTHL